jgi:ribosome-associated protein
MNSNELAKAIADAALDKKASRIVIQDLSEKSDMCEYQVICSGQTERQTQAITDGIEVALRQQGVRPAAIEGKMTGHWILMDYRSVIVHVFMDGIRDFYALENLWPDADLKQVK